MEILFTVFMMLSTGLGDVTIEECRASGEAMGSALMSMQPQCHATRCYTLLRCRDATAEPSEPGEAT